MLLRGYIRSVRTQPHQVRLAAGRVPLRRPSEELLQPECPTRHQFSDMLLQDTIVALATTASL